MVTIEHKHVIILIMEIIQHIVIISLKTAAEIVKYMFKY